MKKIMLTAVCGIAALITGCTTVESTQVFNRVGLADAGDKAVCVTHVEMPGYYFLGLPIVTGSPKGDGEWSLFRYNQTTANVIYLLTKEVKERKAARVVDVHVTTQDVPVMIPFVSKRIIQASGVGVVRTGR